jgi:outer membrane lipoprotein carrier protein
MKITLFLLSAMILTINVYSQTDAEAKDILNKAANKNNGYKTIKTEFKLTTTNPQSGETSSETGKILMQGDKYHLTFLKSDITFDGKAVYTYQQKANEVNISKPEPSKKDKGDFFFTNPRDIFKFYNKDFKSKLIKETEVGNAPCYEIDLYPLDLKTKYTHLRMHILKSSLQIANIKLFLKDGTQHLLEFTNFTPNANISDAEFVFDPKKYPDIQVNDMRF